MPQVARPLPETSPTLVTEHAFPQPSQVDGDHGSIDAANNRLQPALERKQFSSPADGALGENANYMTALQFATRPFDGLRRTVMSCPDGDRSRQPQAPGQQLMVVDGLPYQEPHNRLHASADQESTAASRVI